MRIAGTGSRLTGTVMCRYLEDDPTGVPHRGGLSSVEQLAPAVPLIQVVGELTGRSRPESPYEFRFKAS